MESFGYLVRLKRDIQAWNEWRRANPDYHLDFRGADLQETNLRNADLRSADLRSANLWRANLQEADLRTADLRSADLRTADLRSADLREADLRNADLREADLRDAVFFPDALIHAKLSRARIDERFRQTLKLGNAQNVIWEASPKNEGEGEQREPPRQTISTLTPLGNLDLSLSSIFIRLPREAMTSNEPILLDALKKMKEIRIIASDVTSFQEMAENLLPRGLETARRAVFITALYKTLAEDCAVIAIRNPPVDFGKLLVDKVFPGGTIFTAMVGTGDPLTFFGYVGAATAGLVLFRLGRLATDVLEEPARAFGRKLAQRIDPTWESPGAADREEAKKPKKKK